jgi:hypothetical protein
MKQSFLPILLVVACAATLASRATGVTHVLDLVTARRTPESPGSVSPNLPPSAAVSGHTAHNPALEPRLVVTLESLDRRSYETGDAVIYDLLVKNDGPVPVAMPWSPDAVQFNGRRRGTQVLTAGLYLEIKSETDGRLLANLQPVTLFGAPDVSGTLETLAPGETARIRVPGYWRSSEADINRLLDQPAGTLRAFAMLFIPDIGLRARSTNGEQVFLQDRLHRR